MVKMITWGEIPVKVGVFSFLFDFFCLLKAWSKQEKGEQKHLKEKRTFEYHFWEGRFHILPQSYKIYHCLCFHHFLQFWLIVSQRDQVYPFRCINWDNEVYHFVRESKLIGKLKYLMRSVKRTAEALGIWTEDNWNVKRVHYLYILWYLGG